MAIQAQLPGHLGAGRLSLEDVVSLDLLDRRCLLCSEHEPHHCHRRLVAEYLEQTVGMQLEVRHLM